MLKAVTRQASAVDAKIRQLSASRGGVEMSTAYFFDHHATPADLAVVVTEEDFLAANRELVPSVSQGELAHYEKVRAAFEYNADGEAAAAGKKSRDKGKGKAVVEEDDIAADDAGGNMGGTVRRKKDKGKGKAVMKFQDGTASDDDGLY
jgi:peroxin-6